MKEGRITIKDIARKLNISASTVSRALKNHPDISPDTRQAVQDLASLLNYQPNAIALSLRSRQTRIIGVIIPEVVHHFFSTVISGIEDLAHQEGYQVMICQSNETYEREVQSVQALMGSLVDGIIVSVSKRTENFDHFRMAIEEDTPVVFCDRVCEDIEADKVINDDYFGAYYATKHLIDQGCRRIIHMAATQRLLIGRNRLNGYKQALLDNDIPVDEELIVKCDTYEDGLEYTKLILEGHPRPDGIFAVNDLTAAGAMTAIKNRGLEIPADIAVVGFTNSLIARLSDPPLSSVEQNGYEMGKEACRLLLDRLKREDAAYPSKTKIIKTGLDIKESSRRKK